MARDPLSALRRLYAVARDVDLDRVWRLFGDRFQQRHRLLVLSHLQPQASQQPARGEIVWTDHCRAFR